MQTPRCRDGFISQVACIFVHGDNGQSAVLEERLIGRPADGPRGVVGAVYADDDVAAGAGGVE